MLSWLRTISLRPMLLAGFVGLAPVGASGQRSPEPPDPVATFVDSVSAIEDSVELRDLEARLIQAARRDRGNAGLHLRLGVVADRLGSFREAASEYKWATELEPRWAAAWFRLALTELRIGDEVETSATNRSLISARDAWPRAVRAMTRAIELDPQSASSALAAAGAAADSGRADWARVITDGIRGAVGRLADRPQIWLALGRAERVAGDSGAAILAFEEAARFPTAFGIAQLERARTLLTRGDDRGVDAYFAGSSTADPVALAGYRRDLGLIASPEEARRFDLSSGAARAETLWRFWTERDRAELRQLGERLKEHYRRLAVARARYGSLEDLRARVVVRQGEPDGRASLDDPRLPFNESWWYRRPDADFAVHFVGSKHGSLRLVESVFDIGEGPDARGPAGDDDEASRRVSSLTVLRSRAPLSPFYQALAVTDPAQLRAVLERERAIGRRGVERALGTDEFPIRFSRELAGRLRLVTVLDRSGQAGLSLGFAIPGYAATERPGGDGPPLYPVRARMVVRDAATAVVRAIDTVVVLEPPQSIERTGWLFGEVTVPIEPGRYEARVIVDFDSAGMRLSRDSLMVLDPGVPSLGLTDLLAAIPGGRGGGFDPAPVRRQADTLELRATLVGAAAGRGRFRLLVRADPDRKQERWRPLPGFGEWVPLEVMGRGPEGLSVRVPLRRLGRGRYRLQIVVVDGSGSTVRQEIGFEVDETS